jgi:hypothetical protein
MLIRHAPILHRRVLAPVRQLRAGALPLAGNSNTFTPFAKPAVKTMYLGWSAPIAAAIAGLDLDLAR